MTVENDSTSVKAVKMRQSAEEQLMQEISGQGLRRTEYETQHLLHELQVHQIELEMQNAELRQARDEVEAVLEKYNDLYDLAPVGYFTLDREGVISTLNLTGADLLGIERSLLLGRRFRQFVAEKARPAFIDFHEKVFACQGKEVCEVELLKEGKPPLFVQIEAVATATGQECRAVIIDISARRQSDVDLATRAAELADANADLEAFNYSVSHDLCTPLTTISGYCQVLSEICKDQLDESSKGYIQEIYEGTLRMKRLIASLLDFSRVKRMNIRREVFDLSDIAKDIAAEMKLEEPDNQVSFQIAEGITGRGDIELWRIVLDNLIGNAWKYSGKRKGTVIAFGVTEVDGKRACYVQDNGPGFDMAFEDRLFVPFQRIPGISVEGHGIGLATVERIVKRHGGRIWAKSALGKGATFFFTLE
jgi:signal transduction histidine kinase